MLAYFHSQHAGQSWVTALGRGAGRGNLNGRVRARRRGLGPLSHVPVVAGARSRRPACGCARRLRGKTWLNRELSEIAYGRLQHMDLPVRDLDDRLQRLRTVYGVQLLSLIDYLVGPAGFWGHSAELP